MAAYEEGVVVSVGVGALQYEFIQKLKKRNYFVAAFGHGRNDPRAIEASDFYMDIDTADAVTAISWLNSLGKPIKAAGSYAGGVAVRTLHLIANQYGLPTAINTNAAIYKTCIFRNITV